MGVYGFTWLVASASGMIPRRRWKPTGRIMVIGAFHNPNWYLSHIVPLRRSGVEQIIVVTDEPQLPLEGVSFVCAPKGVRAVLGRVCARSMWVIVAGLCCRPDLYMGYHIIPSACSALIAGKLMGRPTCYQMTGGPVEVAGGGFAALESAGKLLECPSKLMESMILAVIRLFDSVVVRGRVAQRFLLDHDIRSPVAVITGSTTGGASSREDREIDLVFVGRVAATKQVDQFIGIVEMISKVLPSVRAAIVGDGPLLADMKSRVCDLRLSENVHFLGKRTDVQSILATSRIFLLTSKSEGLSIAMAEAMRAGVVPVVADVGELGDLVTDGVNGYLVTPNDIAEYSARTLHLLQNEMIWHQYSQAAMRAAEGYCDVDVVAEKWRLHLGYVITRASRYSDCTTRDGVSL